MADLTFSKLCCLFHKFSVIVTTSPHRQLCDWHSASEALRAAHALGGFTIMWRGLKNNPREIMKMDFEQIIRFRRKKRQSRCQRSYQLTHKSCKTEEAGHERAASVTSERAEASKFTMRVQERAVYS